MPYRMEQLVAFYNSSMMPTVTLNTPCPANIREYIRRHKEMTSLMGDLHNDIFCVIKKNGFGWDDITPVQRSGVTDNNAFIPREWREGHRVENASKPFQGESLR